MPRAPGLRHRSHHNLARIYWIHHMGRGSPAAERKAVELSSSSSGEVLHGQSAIEGCICKVRVPRGVPAFPCDWRSGYTICLGQCISVRIVVPLRPALPVLAARDRPASAKEDAPRPADRARGSRLELSRVPALPCATASPLTNYEVPHANKAAVITCEVSGGPPGDCPARRTPMRSSAAGFVRVAGTPRGGLIQGRVIRLTCVRQRATV